MVVCVTRRSQVPFPGGSYEMGSEDFYSEERPVRSVTVGDLLVDEHPVTNAEFRRFAKDTGHVTVAEKTPEPRDFPDANSELLVPGSQLFTGTKEPVPLDDWTLWWAWAPGSTGGIRTVPRARCTALHYTRSYTLAGRAPRHTQHGLMRGYRRKLNGNTMILARQSITWTYRRLGEAT